MTAHNYWLSGAVQGVGFRWYTQKMAQSLKVAGWVCNLADGRVEVWAQGENINWTQWEAKLRQGPPGSRVTKLEVFEVSPQVGLTTFTVRFHPE